MGVTLMDQPANLLNSYQARILVVDDHPGMATTLARAISQISSGIDVIPATSGGDALNRVGTEAVDLVVTDMMMPDMNGLELIEKLRAHPAGRPAYTILITAYDVPGLKESARRLKVNETLIKPFRPEYLCQLISKALEEMGRAKSPISNPAARQPFKILIADDLADNVSLLSRYLLNEGYTFVSSSNGVETLEKVRSEMPDLVLLDINMPEKDGFEVLQEIRADPAIEHIPVIILTAARPDSLDIQSGLNLGADDYVTKPFDRRELLARIHTKLRAKETDEVIRRRHKELSILPEIGRELSARLDLDELSDVLLRRAVETLGAVVGHVILLGRKEPLHKEYYLTPSPTPAIKMLLPPLEDLVSTIRETHQGLIIEDARRDLRWRSSPEDPNGSVLIAPIFGRLDLIGLLVLFHEQTGYFNAGHQLLLQAIASQAAIAVENLRLYEELVQEQHHTSAVLQSAADAILTFDADGLLTSLNPAGEKLFDGQPIRLGAPLPRGSGWDALIVLLEKARSSRETGAGEIVWGEERVFAAQATPITEEEGCVVLLHDISYFKSLEKAQSDFILAASHDLKGPITSVALLSELIAKAGSLNGKQAEYARRIHSVAQTMSSLIHGLLELGKAELGLELQLEWVDMNALASETIDEFQPQAEVKNLKLRLKTARDQPKIQGDPQLLRQALRNLLGNAIRYTPSGGSVKLAVTLKGDQLALSVSDTGRGIPTEELPFIFDRFYRVRHDGLEDVESDGLGLAIVKSITERHNGRISVISEPGKGSCFTILLPLAQHPQPGNPSALFEDQPIVGKE